MEETTGVRALSALAHGHRLRAFRLLVRAGPDGLSAGELALRLGVSPSSLSFHLTQLQAAGLIRGRRAQRHIFYSLDADTTRELLEFLTEDCCNGRPELCGMEKGPGPNDRDTIPIGLVGDD
ncbi:MAG: helix-turn-helix transcriptional regulator [Gammaproteobacteria bacterium]|nr:helix-turn-helix transcriptional regulator [Gammaproteobacteria bacterium]